ncbi:MAG TPA: hypothetical protein PLM79_11820 [Syntrophobacteraceae bacterium]|nr:hypothetical protein [Syntrophobacteraceae bacterium]
MIRNIHLDPTLKKQLKVLRKAGGRGAAAAVHARNIIDQLLSDVRRNLNQVGRMTRYGEARIKNCVKYDLVRGYRLIGILQGEDLFFVFLGSHDECDHWLRNNAGIENIPSKRRSSTLSVPPEDPDPRESPRVQEPEALEDEILFREIDERDLRIIFRGLCKA